MKFQKILIGALATLSVSITAKADVAYDFETADQGINAPTCFDGTPSQGIPALWRMGIYASDSQWACKNGVLHAVSKEASLKNIAPAFRNGAVYFEIVESSGGAGSARRGETAVWLRNAS